jgi:hypothetical protein
MPPPPSSSDRLTERLGRKAQGLSATLGLLDRLCTEADALLRAVGGDDDGGGGDGADQHNHNPFGGVGGGCAAALAERTAPMRQRAMALRTAQRNLAAVKGVADALLEHLSAARRLAPRVAAAASAGAGGATSPRRHHHGAPKATSILLAQHQAETTDDSAQSFVSDVERLGEACAALMRPLSASGGAAAAAADARQSGGSPRAAPTSPPTRPAPPASSLEAVRPVVAQARAALEQARARLSDELAAALTALPCSLAAAAAEDAAAADLPPLVPRAAILLLQHELLLAPPSSAADAAFSSSFDLGPLPPPLPSSPSPSPLHLKAAAERSRVVARCGAARAAALDGALMQSGAVAAVTAFNGLARRVSRARAAAAEASGVLAVAAAVAAGSGAACSSSSSSSVDPAIARYYARRGLDVPPMPPALFFEQQQQQHHSDDDEEEEDSEDADSAHHHPHPPTRPLPPPPPADLLPPPGALARADPDADAALSLAAEAWLANLAALSELLPCERSLAERLFPRPRRGDPSSIIILRLPSSALSAASSACAAAAARRSLASLAQRGHELVAACRRAGHDRAALLVDVACALEARLPQLERALLPQAAKKKSGGGVEFVARGGALRPFDGSSDDGDGDENDDGDDGSSTTATATTDGDGDASPTAFSMVAGGGGGASTTATSSSHALLADLRAVQKAAERAAGEMVAAYERWLVAAGAACHCAAGGSSSSSPAAVASASAAADLALPLPPDGGVHPLTVQVVAYARRLALGGGGGGATTATTTTTTTPPGAAAAVLFGGGAGAAFAPLPSAAAAAAQREMLRRRRARELRREQEEGAAGEDNDEDDEGADADAANAATAPPPSLHERLFAEAVERLLRALMDALEARARSYYKGQAPSATTTKSPALAALFLANNARYVSERAGEGGAAAGAGGPDDRSPSSLADALACLSLGDDDDGPPSWTDAARLEAEAYADAFHRAAWGPALEALDKAEDEAGGEEGGAGPAAAAAATFASLLKAQLERQRSWALSGDPGLRRRARDELAAAYAAFLERAAEKAGPPSSRFPFASADEVAAAVEEA